MLGEMLEQARFFHQAAGGRVDLLGRRTGGERGRRVACCRPAGSSDGDARRDRPRQQPRRPARAPRLRRRAASANSSTDFRVSPFIETEPVGVVAAGDVPQRAPPSGSARTGRRAPCSTRCSAIERERGRERPHPGAARTLDLDLILFGDAHPERAGPAGAAPALPRTAVRAGAAGRGGAGTGGSGDGEDGGGVARGTGNRELRLRIENVEGTQLSRGGGKPAA